MAIVFPYQGDGKIRLKGQMMTSSPPATFVDEVIFNWPPAASGYEVAPLLKGFLFVPERMGKWHRRH
jgi:hypothetical protein